MFKMLECQQKPLLFNIFCTTHKTLYMLNMHNKVSYSNLCLFYFDYLTNNIQWLHVPSLWSKEEHVDYVYTQYL